MKGYLSVLSKVVLLIFVISAIFVFIQLQKIDSVSSFLVTTLVIFNGLIFLGILEGLSKILDYVEILTKKVCPEEMQKRVEEQEQGRRILDEIKAPIETDSSKDN